MFFIFIFPDCFSNKIQNTSQLFVKLHLFWCIFCRKSVKKIYCSHSQPLPPISAKKEMLSRISGTACRTGVRKYISRSYCSFHYVLTEIPASYCFPAIASIYSKSRLNFSSCSSILSCRL